MVNSKTIEILSTIKKEPDLFAQQLCERFGYSQEQLDELRTEGLVAQPQISNGRYWNKYHITIKGENLLFEAELSRKKALAEWARWTIDLAIAVASFVTGYFLGAA